MDNFPERVTLFEDRVYRWRYDMDLRHNRYMIRLIVKIISIILGIPLLFILAILARNVYGLMQRGVVREEWSFYLEDDLLVLAVVGGALLLLLLLAEGIYAIVSSVKGGTYRICFQMDETSVSLVRNPNTVKAMNILGWIAAVTDIASGKHGAGVSYAMSQAAGNGTSRFEGIGRVVIREEYDVLDLRALFEMNQIYVPREDFEAVKEYILARVPEKARRRS